jgi:hypothetical protein
MSIFNLFLAGVLAISSIFSGSYESRLGVTIATTSQSDTIGTFRTNVNTSLENIKTDLENVSSTVGTYGTIAVEDAPLVQNKGGTGLSTYPTDGQFLSSNGTTSVWKSLTSDGSITIATTTTSTQISTVGINTASDFTWSGAHTFTGGVSSTATTTLATTTMTGTLGFSTYLPTVTTSTNPADNNLISKYYADVNYNTPQILTGYTRISDTSVFYPSFLFSASTTLAYNISGTDFTHPTYKRFYVPRSGTLQHSMVISSSTLDGTVSFYCEAVVDGATTTLKSTIPNGASTSGINTTTTVSVSAGSYIGGRCTGTGAGTNNEGLYILEFK